MRSIRLAVAISAVVAAVVQIKPAADSLAMPNRPGSVKFAAIGDNGTGDQPEYEIADRMTQWHGQFGFDIVIMLGDNLYGSQGSADFVQKFERPFRPLLDGGVR